jgi:UDP-N-acetylmuramoyl-L-alanyl-D-glutamate--2,6-diaminopimelate ligase
MAYTLKKLIAGIDGIQLKGKDSVGIQALATDSRRVGRGSLFFALPGLRTDGHFFVAEAIDRGAVGVVCEKDCWVPPNVSLVIVKDLRAALARMAARFYGNPEAELELTGFLGTSGKTVASHLMRTFLQRLNRSACSGRSIMPLGTVRCRPTGPLPNPSSCLACFHKSRTRVAAGDH